MAITLVKDKGSEEYSIRDKEGNEFTLLVRKPSVKDRMLDDSYFDVACSVHDRAAEELMSRDWHRIESLVTGWKGVLNEDESAVPFSQENLILLMTDRVIAEQVIRIAGDLYTFGESKEQLKNSAAPSETSSADGAETASTFPAGENSEDSSESASTPD